MINIVLSTMLMYLIHLALPKILTFKNHRDFSPIKERLEKDPNIPTDLQVLINNNNIGMILLRLVEIIGEDQIDNLGTETLYFIVAVLNETNLDNLRNKIIIKTLPNRV